MKSSLEPVLELFFFSPFHLPLAWKFKIYVYIVGMRLQLLCSEIPDSHTHLKLQILIEIANMTLNN